MSTTYKSDVEAVQDLVVKYNSLRKEIGKVIIGQDEVVRDVLISIFSRGHCLLVGVPGLAKTLLVNTIAQSLGLTYNRIQFTPDLMPSDIIGTEILDESRHFRFIKGPLFSNIILADEINRTPPKTQSALLEAMQEHHVTISKERYRLPEPFMVMATQNPIEQEGTYPLPEAAIDRFMLKVKITYPSRDEEVQIIDAALIGVEPKVDKVITPQEIMDTRSLINQIYIDEKLKNYIVDLARASRQPEDFGLNDIKGLIQYGASPRASIYLAQAAKGHAFIRRRGYVTPDDIKTIGMDVLRHRIILTYEAEAEEQNAETIIQKVFDAIEVP